MPEAKIRGYDQGRFSFNVKGGDVKPAMENVTIEKLLKSIIEEKIYPKY